MAKARLHEDESGSWDSLFDDLKAVVLADKIACPELEFQRIEAQLDSRIKGTVGRIIDELSWGLEFNPYEVILHGQIEDAAYRFLGKTSPRMEAWSIAFKSDPQAPVKSRMKDIFGIKGRINVSFSLPDEIIEQDRQRKLRFADEAQEMQDRYSKNPLGWSELVLQSKRSFMDGFWGTLARQSMVQQLREDSPLSQLRARETYNELMSLWNRLQGIGIDTNDPKEVMAFAESEELLDSPFVDINASIWAAIAKYHIQGRRIDKGDFYDAPILASVLPYCNVITTDRFMKEILVNRLRFDEKYNCKVFSAGKTDRLAFRELIKKLKSEA